MTTSTKPLVILCVSPITGHVNPLKPVAKALVLRGYNVTVVCSSHFRRQFEEIGCSFVAIQGYGDFWDGEFPTLLPERNHVPPGPERLTFDMEKVFAKATASQFDAVQKAIKMLKEKHGPAIPIVQVNEGLFMGALPIMKGADGVKPHGTIAISVIPIILSSVDTAPFGPGLPPPTSADEVAKYEAIKKQIESVATDKPTAVFVDIAKKVGVKEDNFDVTKAMYTWPDRFLQLCPPSAEYPRSDLPRSIIFAGAPYSKPTKERKSENFIWWNEVVNKPLNKDVIFVCQGTVNLDYSEIVVPLMEALKDRPNTLVIVALGVRGAILDPSISVPDNVRVADYVPYDNILPYSSAFVTNGGYQGFLQSIASGTPMVVAGLSEDKAETCARAEWTGMAINLRTNRPTGQALRDAVDEIISNSKYKNAAQRLQAEMESIDTIGIIAQNIDEVAA